MKFQSLSITLLLATVLIFSNNAMSAPANPSKSEVVYITEEDLADQESDLRSPVTPRQETPFDVNALESSSPVHNIRPADREPLTMASEQIQVNPEPMSEIPPHENGDPVPLIRPEGEPLMMAPEQIQSN